MATWNTMEALSDALNLAIADWMDAGKVDHSDCPVTHQAAWLHSQWRIGWNQVVNDQVKSVSPMWFKLHHGRPL